MWKMAGIGWPTVDGKGAAAYVHVALSSEDSKDFTKLKGAIFSGITLMKKRTARDFEQRRQRRESHPPRY